MRLEDLRIRTSATIAPDGSVFVLRAPCTVSTRPLQQKPKRRAEIFAKKCCGTGYGQPHVIGCNGKVRQC